MKKMICSGLAIFLLLMQQGMAYAETCQVAFRAKRTVKENRWFGSVSRPEFKSGVVSGEGASLKACEQDALAQIRKEGWIITYQRTLRSGGRNDRSRADRPTRLERYNR